MAGLLLPELWRDTASCAEFGVASHPSYDGASLRSAAADCFVGFNQQLQLTSDGRLDVVVRDADACVDGSRAVLVTTSTTPPHSLDRPFGPEDAGVLFRWHCDRKVVRPANGAHVLSRSDGETITCAPRGSLRLRLHANRAEFLDDACPVASAALALDRRPLSVFVAASGTSAPALFGGLSIRTPCAAADCGGEERGVATGTRLYGVPGVDGCACRCNAGFAGETCDVSDAPPPPLDVLADAPAGGLELLVSARPAGCGGVALRWQAAVGRLGSTRAAVFVSSAGARRFAGWSTNGSLAVRDLPAGRSAAFHVVTYSDADTVASRSAAVSSLPGDCGGSAAAPATAAPATSAAPPTPAPVPVGPSTFAVAVVALGAACAPPLVLLLLALLARVRRGGGGSFAKLSTDEEEAPPRPPPGRAAVAEISQYRQELVRSEISHYASVVNGSKPRETDSPPRSVSERRRAIEATGAKPPSRVLAAWPSRTTPKPAAAPPPPAAPAPPPLPPPPSSAASEASAFARQLLQERAPAPRESARVRGDGRAQEALAQLAKLAPLVSEEAARRRSHEPR